MSSISNGSKEKQLNFLMLTGMIVGSTIGAGVFSLAGDMASEGANTAAVLVGWLICGIGMFGLMMSFFGLNKRKPELTNGIYSYAREGFGEFVGFNSAWGYWISALLCNVSYTTLLFQAIGYFFPVFGAGNNLVSIICASVVIWTLNYLVLYGVKEAAAVNIITTASKLLPIFVFIIAVIFVGKFKLSIFMDNFWGEAGGLAFGDQVKATTGATVWAFIGIEGAVVLSGRAKKSKDVGKASIIGFLCIFLIYLMTSILSMGVMTRAELAELGNPQMAGILEFVVGKWGAVLINLGVILSLAGALLSWTIIAADCPYSAAKQGVFSKIFAKENKKGSPSFALFATNGIIQLFIIIIFFQESTYQAFYTMSASMIMVPYLLSALYYAKITFKKESFELAKPGELLGQRIIGVLGSVYGLWLIYAGGLKYLLITAILYAPGILIYIKGKKEKNEKLFNNKIDIIIACAIVALAIISVVCIATGALGEIF